MLRNDEKNWGMFCHVAVFAGAVIPGANIVAPLVIWLLKKDEYAFVNEQGKEVVNFQITVTIALGISFILSFFIIGFFLMIAVGVVSLIYTVLGIIKTSEGLSYRYPMSIKILK